MSRALYVTFLAMFLITFALPTQPTNADGKLADLQEQLEDGLKARLPRDFAFIKRVVMLVDEQTLPLKLVKSTFQWARKKAKYKNYPFPYFERALRIRAKKLGITI